MTSTVAPASTAYQPGGGSVRTGLPVRRPRWNSLPLVVSRVFFAGGILMVAEAALPGVAWVGWLVDVFSTVFFPVDGGNVGFAVFVLLLGTALARRKRVGWVLALVIFAFSLLGDLAVVAGLIDSLFGVTSDYGALSVYARFAFNLAALGALTACLIHYRAEFTARRPPGSARLALLTLLVGLGLTVGVGMALVSVFPNELVGPRGRLVWLGQRLVRFVLNSNADLVTRPVSSPPSWINSVVGLLLGATLLAALVVLMRSQRRAALMSAEDEPRVRALVAQSPADSLAYFATRRDKAVVFAASGAAAVTYRVDLGVCLASSDPIGPPERWDAAIAAWQGLNRIYGWIPAVLGASEAGATAYARTGMRVIRIGDEAVLYTRDFHLDGRDMRPVRQAVQRLERLGYRTRIRRHGDIDRGELLALIGLVDAWRDTENERGFSMALGRLGDPADADCLMVEALFPAGQVPPAPDGGTPGGDVAGVLSFVPWGEDGYSLDVMRRNPGADNGVTELMVAGLMAAGRERRIARVSLNFAVFRSAFEEGARIGAGPVLRLWRRLLLVASHWWQFESLYRSNVKYRPEWSPRFLCFAETRDIALVGAALGVAEGFIDVPAFVRPVVDLGPPARALAAGEPATGGPGTPPAVVGVPAAGPAVRLPEQVRLRMATRQRLLDTGTDPYPPSFRRRTTASQLQPGTPAQVAGRVLAVRDLGGVIFVVLRDWSGDAQLLLSADTVSRADLDRLRHDVDLGDHLGAQGQVGRSRSGELSVLVTGWELTAKALRPLPDKRGGLADPEARVRQRYLDLIMNADARRRLAARSAVLRAVRTTLDGRGFLEVETPMLQTVHGGANARPFRTHINAYDLDLYLRIAPELYLKRLMVGGLDKVFEIGRNFRNEGADATHNPEFTMLEAYEAYGDYHTMRVVAQELITTAAREATGTTVVRGTDAAGVEHEIDLAQPWPVVTVDDAVSKALGAPVSADTDRDTLVALARSRQLTVEPTWSRGAVLLEL